MIRDALQACIRSSRPGYTEWVRLDPLFEGDLEYEEAEHTAVSPYGDGRWFGYTPAHGSIRGQRLTGRLRCHNLYHQQSVEPEVYRPRYRGAIDTDDGALILWDAEGLNRFDGQLGTVVMHMTFQSAEERYRWLNGVMAVVEALCFATDGGPATERWTLRAFECINDMSAT